MNSTSSYGGFTTEKEHPGDGPNCFGRREYHLPLPASETWAVQPVAIPIDYVTLAVINSLPIGNVPFFIFLSLNTSSVLQIR
jgi:hypothetical protein